MHPQAEPQHGRLCAVHPLLVRGKHASKVAVRRSGRKGIIQILLRHFYIAGGGGHQELIATVGEEEIPAAEILVPGLGDGVIGSVDLLRVHGVPRHYLADSLRHTAVAGIAASGILPQGLGLTGIPVLKEVGGLFRPRCSCVIIVGNRDYQTDLGRLFQNIPADSPIGGALLC